MLPTNQYPARQIIVRHKDLGTITFNECSYAWDEGMLIVKEGEWMHFFGKKDMHTFQVLPQIGA